jgi:hypothetical protein
MRVRNIDQDPDSLHQRIIADDDLGFTQAIIAQRQGCAQSTVSQVLAAERLRRLRAELGRDADGSDGPETSVRALHAAEQVKEARIREGRGKASEGRPAASRGRRRQQRSGSGRNDRRTRLRQSKTILKIE